MIYMYILTVICAAIFIVADFFTHGLDNFNKWEFYVWLFVVVFNGYIVLTHKAGDL